MHVRTNNRRFPGIRSLKLRGLYAKISAPYLAYPVSHSDLNKGSLLLFNSYINSMTNYCLCRQEKECALPSGVPDTSSPTTRDDQFLIIFVKQTEIEDIEKNPKVLNLIAQSPQQYSSLMIGHAVIQITEDEIEDDSGQNIKTEFVEIVGFCKHQGPDVPSRLGYEKVMLNALLRYSDRICQDHYQWITVNPIGDYYESIISILTEYGFGYPHVVTSNFDTVEYEKPRISLFKRNTHIGTNQAENRINYVKAIHVRDRLQGRNLDAKFIFDEKTLNNLRLLPFFATKHSGVDHCTPTTPISEAEIDTIVEYGGRFVVTDANIDNGSPYYILSMESPSKGFYSYKVGDPESISNVPRGSFNFHTHPFATYKNRITSDSYVNGVFVPKGSKVLISGPSTGDYAYVHYHTTHEKMDPIQFHSVVAVEGIWTVSVTKSALENKVTTDFIKNAYMFSFGMGNQSKALMVEEKYYTGYQPEGTDVTRIGKAVQEYIGVLEEYNKNHGNVFNLQFRNWRDLSNKIPFVFDESTIGSGQFLNVERGKMVWRPSIILEDVQKIAKFYEDIDNDNVYGW